MVRYIITNGNNIISIIETETRRIDRRIDKGIELGGEFMDICKMLYVAKRDEAGGILFYNKLKSSMPSEHAEHIETIETYIEQEYDHLKGVEEMIKGMECPELSKDEEIHIIIAEIYERINEIEKIGKVIGGEKGDKIHRLAEEIEKKFSEID